LQQREARVGEARGVDERRLDEAGRDCVDAYPPLLELRCDAADETDYRVLGERVDRILGGRNQARERRGDEDGASGLHYTRQPPDAEDDTVEVRSEDPTVGVVRQPADVSLAGDDAGVETCELNCADGVPGVRVRDVESVGEVER